MSRVIISPHADDEILGVGGTISKLQGTDDFTIVEITHCSNDRRSEFEEATSLVNNIQHVEWLGFKDGGMSNLHIPQIARAISSIVMSVNPSHVYIPYNSLHQDHQLVNHACLIALRNYYGCVLEYEYVEGLSQFASMDPNYFESISDTDITTKCSMIECFKSQVGYLRDSKSLHSLATVRGFSAGSDYAEGFRLVRQVSK